MTKKVKGGIPTRLSKQMTQKTEMRQWTGPAPYAETEYPFEPAIEVSSYSKLLQRDRGPGIRLYHSTICICRPDSHDSLLLTKIGEQFREFYPDELPWLEKAVQTLSEEIWEDDRARVEDSLRYFAEQGFLDLDASMPERYRYRLNVDAVRQAKNRCFRPMSRLERIEAHYHARFSDEQRQLQAFRCICDGNEDVGRLLWNLWERSLERVEKVGGDHAAWILGAVLSFEESERSGQAMQWLQEKGFLERRRGRWSHYDYRPDVLLVWEALAKLPDPLPEAPSAE